MSLDNMSGAIGRRSTPGVTINTDSKPIISQIKDINLSDSKIPKSKILTNQNEIFGVLDMSPPEGKKTNQSHNNPEVTGFQRSEQTSATGSQLSHDSPARLLKEAPESRIPLYKRLCGRTHAKSNLFKPKFDCSLLEQQDLSEPE
jgi:hypothetical protein